MRNGSCQTAKCRFVPGTSPDARDTGVANYVISMARTASDVLAVILLLRAGARRNLNANAAMLHFAGDVLATSHFRRVPEVEKIFAEIRYYEWETGRTADIAYMVDQCHNEKPKVEAMLDVPALRYRALRGRL